MAIVKALSYNAIEDIEVATNRAVNEEILLKIIRNINMLGDLSVIGEIKCMALNQPGVSVPSPTIFQMANGGEITEPTSPLRSTVGTDRFTPDMTGRFIRGADSSTTIGNEAGGQASQSTTHDHTGNTAEYCDPVFDVATDGEDLLAPNVNRPCHHHSIESQQIDVTLDPYHLEVTMFLKIT